MGSRGVMACHPVSRAVMTARFSQASRISALEPNGWAWVTAKPPSPSMRMWSPLVSLAGQLDGSPPDGVVAGGHDPAPWSGPGPGGMIREGTMTSAVERVVADDVDGHQVGPFLVADDPCFAGVAACADLGLAGVELVGGHPGAAQHVRRVSPTLVGRIHKMSGSLPARVCSRPS